jgi:hypothetical protein
MSRVIDIPTTFECSATQEIMFLCNLISDAFEDHQRRCQEYLAMATPQVTPTDLQFRMATFTVDILVMPDGMEARRDHLKVELLASPMKGIWMGLTGGDAFEVMRGSWIERLGGNYEYFGPGFGLETARDQIMGRVEEALDKLVPEGVDVEKLRASNVGVTVNPTWPLVEPVEVAWDVEDPTRILDVDKPSWRRERMAENPEERPL